jgi:hypothetical protein
MHCEERNAVRNYEWTKRQEKSQEVKIKAVNRMPRDVIQEQFAEIKKKTLSTH